MENMRCCLVLAQHQFLFKLLDEKSLINCTTPESFQLK